MNLPLLKLNSTLNKLSTIKSSQEENNYENFQRLSYSKLNTIEKNNIKFIEGNTDYKSPIYLDTNERNIFNEEEEKQMKDNFLKKKIEKFRKFQAIEFRDRKKRVSLDINLLSNPNRNIKDLEQLKQTKAKVNKTLDKDAFELMKSRKNSIDSKIKKHHKVNESKKENNQEEITQSSHSSENSNKNHHKKRPVSFNNTNANKKGFINTAHDVNLLRKPSNKSTASSKISSALIFDDIPIPMNKNNDVNDDVDLILEKTLLNYNNHNKEKNRKFAANKVKLNLNKGTKIEQIKGGKFNNSGLPNKYETKLDKNDIKETEKKIKKAKNIFRTGLNEMCIKNGYLNFETTKNNIEVLRDKSNIVPNKKPYSFEFNYEKRRNEDPLAKFKTSYIENAFLPVEASMKFYNLKCQNSLIKQTSVSYKKPFQVSSEKNFQPPFRVCLDVLNLEEDVVIAREMERLSNQNKSLEFNKIKENKLKEETMKNFKNEEEEKPIDNTHLSQEERHKIRIRLRDIIIKASMEFKKFNITAEEFYENKFVLLKPLELKNSEVFLNAAREGEFNCVHNFLKLDRKYSRVFDHFGQTALHVVAKKNQYHIISLLVNYGCLIDSEDYCYRTPLHIAVMNNSIECIKLLLKENANPLKKTSENKSCMELATNYPVSYLFRRLESLYSIYFGLNPKQKFEKINKSIKYIFEELDKMIQIEKDNEKKK